MDFGKLFEDFKQVHCGRHIFKGLDTVVHILKNFSKMTFGLCVNTFMSYKFNVCFVLEHITFNSGLQPFVRLWCSNVAWMDVECEQ